MAREAAKTGADPTVMIAIEQFFPKGKRIIEDDLALRILPSQGFVRLMKAGFMRDWMVKVTERAYPGLWSCIVCRKRYIDERLAEEAGRTDAVVNMGAGFDTRAYRLPQLKDVPVWEVDQPNNIASKQTRLVKIFGRVPPHVRLAAMDFDRQDLGGVLQANGYSEDMRTFFIWEAVTQYLTEPGIRKTFAFLSKAASGSRLAFTYVRKDFIDGQNKYGWETLYNRYVPNHIWIFGMEPGVWPEFLKEYGWEVIEDIGYGDMAERYVKPAGRTLASTPVERMVYAKKV